jgi:hypothetical protein
MYSMYVYYSYLVFKGRLDEYQGSLIYFEVNLGIHIYYI